LIHDIIVNKKDAFEKASKDQPFQKNIKENGVLLYAQLTVGCINKCDTEEHYGRYYD